MGLVFHHHHGSYGFNQGSVISFGDLILLRSVGCGVLVLNTFIAEELIQSVVLELRTIVAYYCNDLGVELALKLVGELHHGPLSLTFNLEEENPTIS
jgi:hypothetical protein